MATKPLKVALPGPLTFAVMAEDQRNGGAKPEHLVRELAVTLRKEVEAAEPEALARLAVAWHGIGSAGRGQQRTHSRGHNLFLGGHRGLC